METVTSCVPLPVTLLKLYGACVEFEPLMVTSVDAFLEVREKVVAIQLRYADEC